MSKPHYFPRLLIALLVAIAIVGVDAVATRTPSWFGLLALVPLLAYSASLATQRTRSTAEIDSVYYFGFLITVSALAATALEIGRTTNPQLERILPKFAVGLLATGAAVIARLYLQSKEPGHASQSPEETAAAAALQATQLLEKLSVAAAQIGALTATAMEETSRVSVVAQEAVRAIVREAAGTFKTEVEQAARGAKDAVAQVSDVIGDRDFAEARLKFAESLAVGARATNSAISAIQEMGNAAGATGESMRDAARSTSSVASSAREAAEQLEALCAPSGALTHVAEATAQAAGKAAAAAESARAAAEGVEVVQSRLAGTAGALQGFSTAISATSRECDDLRSSLGGADVSITQLTASLSEARGVAEGIAQIGPSVSAAITSLQRLAAELEGVNATVTSSGGRAEREIQGLTHAVAALTNELTRIARVIVQQTRERMAV